MNIKLYQHFINDIRIGISNRIIPSIESAKGMLLGLPAGKGR